MTGGSLFASIGISDVKVPAQRVDVVMSDNRVARQIKAYPPDGLLRLSFMGTLYVIKRGRNREL